MVSAPRLNRVLECARVTSTHMAPITCDGSSEPEVQAEPLEAAMPYISRLSNSDSPSIFQVMLDGDVLAEYVTGRQEQDHRGGRRYAWEGATA